MAQKDFDVKLQAWFTVPGDDKEAVRANIQNDLAGLMSGYGVTEWTSGIEVKKAVKK